MVLVGYDESFESRDFLRSGCVLEIRGLVVAKFLDGRSDLLAENVVDFLDFRVFLLDGPQGRLLARFVHACACSLLHHAEDFDGAHVEHLGDAALHNEEVRIVHIQLHGMEQGLHTLCLSDVTVDEVLVAPSNRDLSCNCDRCHVLISERRLLRVTIVENKCDRSLCDACLALFIHEFLQRRGPNLAKVSDPKYEAD